MAVLYSTRGLKRGASEADINKAYRKLAKELHPDRNKDNAESSSRFSEVTHAYDLLSDADKRAQYDRGEIDEQGNPRAPFGYSPGAGRGGFGGQRGEGVHFEFGEGGDFGDIFSDLRSEEHTSELQSLMRNSYAVFCLKKKNNTYNTNNY